MNEVINAAGIKDLTRKTLALVRVKGRMSIAPDVVYQVTINPLMLSPAGQYIRFDQMASGHQWSCGNGSRIQDELHGWFEVHSIEIVEVLGEYDDAGYPPIPTRAAGTIVLEDRVVKSLTA